MTKLRLKNIKKRFGGTEVIRGVDLEVDDGEFVVFVGPSGCGKSTLLRLISGLEHISDGELHIGDRQMNEVQASQRGVAMVFQSYALYPHLTVRENMGFGLKVRKVPAPERRRRVEEAAATLKLEALLERYPRELSGGQRQRVAIGRAIVGNPNVFLFDEPLSNLDAELRVHMRSEIAALHNRLSTTMIYVTHDQVEAMTLADKIVVLRDGLIEQVGSPRALYDRPDNMFVAQFIGSPKMNILPVENVRRLSRTAKVPESAESIGIRPEHLDLAPPSEGALNGKVRLAEYTGAVTLLHIELPDGQTCLVVHDGRNGLEIGTDVGLRTGTESLHFFDRNGRAIREKVHMAPA
ncbi:ABC transporter ATP-binding protein [Mesorhizobium sp. WSM4904]|uniref:ABC transporter ATP-binding protein n=1 Tax=Mesorhizobium sp. WSM4904 TaxID=3038545 RepID=UPI00241855AA|nr:ABC transporter ATP-binding protein [Mesorhizobium sp. WSM4904]WFP62901.1 ABC transporter ATP-binding protein [Mesorhizobium sp. WSM4904]